MSLLLCNLPPHMTLLLAICTPSCSARDAATAARTMCQRVVLSRVALSCLAEWEDREAFKKHIKSDYVKDFAEYITEVSSHCCAVAFAELCAAFSTAQ